MRGKTWMGSSSFRSDNRESKIENLKWVGIVVIGFTFAMCGAVAQAQQAPKIFRIGYMDLGTASGSAVLVDAFRQELSKLGWVEGKNINFEYRFAEQNNERLPDFAAELVRLKVDLMVVSGTTAALPGKSATTSIPTVMANAADPVGAGLVTSLAKPGGNVTGLSSLSPELSTKRLEVLRDAVPKLTRVGLLRSLPRSTVPSTQLNEIRAAALSLKLKLEEIETPLDPKSLDNAFQTARQKQVRAFMTLASRAVFAERKRIVELANKHRLPAIYFQKEFVEDGGLMSYGADYEDLFRKAAHYVDKILKGAKPADLPVQQATKFEFIINLKAAKQIGLTLSPEFLSRANQVIK
jgi:putative ABC transport system substrate-binding protein